MYICIPYPYDSEGQNSIKALGTRKNQNTNGAAALMPICRFEREIMAMSASNTALTLHFCRTRHATGLQGKGLQLATTSRDIV